MHADEPHSASASHPSPVFLVSLAGIAILFIAHVLLLNAVADDAFITFRYARNVSLGHGWVWNVGEPPVEGFTSFLWVILCGLATRLELDVARTAQAIGILASFGTLACTFRFARRRLGLDAPLALIPVCMLVCSGPFATWAGSAMETNLFGLFVLAAAYHFTGDSRQDDAPGRRVKDDDTRPILVAVLLFLGTLTRPEGFGVLGIFVVIMILGRRLPWLVRPPTWRHNLLLLVAYGVPFVAYFAWRYATFGDYLPNTFHAKTGLSIFIPLRGLLYTGYFLLFYVGPWLPLLLVFRARRRARREVWFGRSPLAGDAGDAGPVRSAVVVVLTMLLAYGAYILAVGGDYMAMYRFFVPLLPLVYLLIGLAVSRVLADTHSSRPGRRLALVCIGLGFAFTLVHSTPLDRVIFGRPRAQQGHYAGVMNERYAVTRFAAVGRFFDAYKRGPEEVLATKVIGAMGFYADMKILDMLGITDRHISRSGRSTKPLGLGFPGHERSDLLYVARRRPTYVFLELADQRQPLADPDWGAEANAILRQEYGVHEARIVVPGRGDGWLYFLERKREQSRN